MRHAIRPIPEPPGSTELSVRADPSAWWKPLGYAGKHLARGMFHALSDLGTARISPPRNARDAAHRLAGTLTAIARAHDMHVQISGEIPRGRALIIANHVSYLDPIAILPYCPAVPVAKGEVSGWPVIGPIASSLGVQFVQRSNPFARVATLRRIHDLLAGGTPVLNFAEGTTTSGASVGPFWRGTFGVAQRLDVPVVPVAIRYREPDLAWFNQATFLPHYWRTVCRPRLEVALTFGTAMHPRAGESPEAMAARARGIIRHMLDHTRWTDAGRSTGVSPSRSDSVLPAARSA